jgi:hypothetical protein
MEARLLWAAVEVEEARRLEVLLWVEALVEMGIVGMEFNRVVEVEEATQMDNGAMVPMVKLLSQSFRGEK